MRIIKYYEHTVNPGEVAPLRLRALEETIAARVCDLLNIVYHEYGNTIIEIEFRRADVQYVHCNRRREATFALALHRKDSIIDDIFVTINYNTNELISVESNCGPAFNRTLFNGLSERLEKNEKEDDGMDKKCINRANVYKTMTDNQKIVMQDAIANAVESTIKDCRMEYEKTLKAQQLKIDNYKGLINRFYGENGILSKLDRLKNFFEVQKIIINEPAMIVFWKDGTKTVVTATDEAFDEEKGLAMAFAKKALGNNYAAGGRFKAKLKHAERVKRKEETVENDISKIPICKEIMDEAMRRVKAEMESASKKEPTKRATSAKKKK